MIRRPLAAIGAPVRRRFQLVLGVASLIAFVAAAIPRPGQWRAPVRAEFRRALVQATLGGLSSVVVMGAIIGLSLVYQAIFWLGLAGQEALLGRALVLVLLRELTPLLVGLLLLGRSGMPMLVELGTLQSAGQVRALAGLGLDPFRLFLLPRAAALAVAGFTLGMIFFVVALAFGFAAGRSLGAIRVSALEFAEALLLAMAVADFVVFPTKLLLIGAVVALTSCLTALDTPPGAPGMALLAVGFARGLVAVLLVSVMLTVAI
jgi:phospholipid/cholesterol/gamma-HCH transport system permease protein